MIDHHMDNTRRQLGELGAMAQQTEAMERRILSIAEKKLSKIGEAIDKARVQALTGDDAAKERYMSMVKERGVLQQVIARAKAELTPA